MIDELLMQYLPLWLDNKYIIAAIIFAAFFFLSKLFVYIVKKVILRLTSRTKTKLDDMLVQKTNGPISWLLIFIGFKIALEYLDLKNGIAFFLGKTVNSLMYISVSLVLIAFLVTFIEFWGHRIARKTKSTMDDALLPLFKRTVKAAILIIVAIMVLDLWGVNVTGLLAGVGIAGIAIGFAVKDSLGNIFGGISLILDKTFNVGDKIELDNGTMGVVSDISIRSTRIKTNDNEMITVPNGILANSRIKNYNQPDLSARVAVLFSIEYGEDPEKAKRIVLAEINRIKEALNDPKPVVRFLAMADSSLNMSAYFWVSDISKVVDAKEEATYRIYQALKKNRIGIPFPTRTVYIKK